MSSFPLSRHATAVCPRDQAIEALVGEDFWDDYNAGKVKGMKDYFDVRV